MNNSAQQNMIYNVHSVNYIDNEIENIEKELIEDISYDLASFYRWFPDLFLDTMSNPNSKKKLTLYQRVLLRVMFRFKNTYTTIPRGSAKSFIQLLAYLLLATMYPNIKLSIIAETKEQSASIIKDKFNEITEEWYPFFKDEIKSTSFQRDIAIIEFKNGSRIDNLANAQTTKGQRRTRGGVDESARLNNAIFKDAVQPVFSLRRWTGGDVQDPYELNGQFHFFTTAGFKGTEEFIRTMNFVNDMADCKGSFVFGADWELPVHWGLLTKKFVMDIKNDETTSPIAFQQNYQSVWVGAGESGLVQIDKVLALRNPDLKVELKQKGNCEYVICMDVARSKSSSNNQSAYVVGKINRLKNGAVKNVDIVNIFIPINGLTFKDQSIILKRLQKAYNSQMVIVDSSGIGKAICDYCIEELEDSETGEVFGAWDCINDETFKCKEDNAPKLLYSLNASSINTQIIVNFWDYIDSMKLNLLPSERNAKISNKLSELEKIDIMSAHMRTDTLIEQLANLQVINRGNSVKMDVKQVTKKIDKDIYSALVYLLYVVQTVMNEVKRQPKHSHADYTFYD